MKALTAAILLLFSTLAFAELQGQSTYPASCNMEDCPNETEAKDFATQQYLNVIRQFEFCPYAVWYQGAIAAWVGPDGSDCTMQDGDVILINVYASDTQVTCTTDHYTFSFTVASPGMWATEEGWGVADYNVETTHSGCSEPIYGCGGGPLN